MFEVDELDAFGAGFRCVSCSRTNTRRSESASNRGATGGVARAASRSAANSRSNRSTAFGPSTSCLTATGAPVLSISQTRDLGLLRSLCTRRAGPNSARSSSPKGTSDHIRGFSHIPQGTDSDDSGTKRRMLKYWSGSSYVPNAFPPSSRLCFAMARSFRITRAP